MVFNIKINRENKTYFLLKSDKDNVESIKLDLKLFFKLEINEMRLYHNLNVI